MSEQNATQDPNAESPVRFTNDEVQAIASAIGATIMTEPEFIVALATDAGTREAVRKMAAVQPEDTSLRFILDTALQVADVAAQAGAEPEDDAVNEEA